MCNKISIIVPIYNVEKYVSRCIESILDQTFTEFELILVNDGSTDSCCDICNEFKKKDSRVIVINQENRGLSAARNSGIDLATGKYITFIDGDDYIHTEMLKILYDNIIKTNSMISVCDYKEVLAQQRIKTSNVGQIPYVITGLEAVKEIVDKRNVQFIIACAKLYKTELFDDIRFPIGKYYEDEYITYKLLFYSQHVSITKDKLYYYLQHSESITNRPFDIKRLHVLEPIQDAIGFFRLQNREKLTNLAVYRYLFLIQVIFYRAKYEMRDNELVLSNLLERYKCGMEQYYNYSKKDITLYRKTVLKLFLVAPNLYSSLIRPLARLIEFIKGKTL